MKILFFIEGDVISGIIKVALEEAYELLSKGHDVYIVAGYPLPLEQIYYTPNNDNFRVLAPLRSSIFISLSQNLVSASIRDIYSLMSTQFLINVLKKERLDWIICHNMEMLPYAIYVSNIFKARVALIVHNECYPPILYSRILSVIFPKIKRIEYTHKLINKYVDVVIAIHRFTYNILQRIYGIKADYILPLGCRPLKEIPKKRGNYVLVVGRISRGKKIIEIAKMISIIDSNTPIIFAGGIHRTTRYVIKQLQRINLKRYRIILNPPDSVLCKLYKGARMLVSFGGLPQLEAAGYGCPSVAPKDLYSTELFKHGVHGYFVEYKDSSIPLEVYIKYISELLKDERKAWKMGYSAWRLCKEKYTWRKHTERLLKILKKSQ